MGRSHRLLSLLSSIGIFDDRGRTCLPSFSLLQTTFIQTTLSGVASYTDPLCAVFLLRMPPVFLWDTHVEQTPDQGSRVPTGPHLLALQEEGARLPRSRGGRPAVRARVKLPDIPEPNATKASWEVFAFLEGGQWPVRPALCK